MLRIVRSRWMWTTALTAGIAIGLLAMTSAQRFYRFGYAPAEANARYDGRFTFARLKYTGSAYNTYYKGLPSWAHGYARTDSGVPAEHQMMQILDAISAVHPRLDATNVFALDDPDLCEFPVSYMTEAGFWVLGDEEARAFGAYLKKGGFVIFDDFRDPPRGGGGWATFEANMHRVLPGLDIVDLDPSDPIFHTFFDIDSFDIIPQFYDTERPTIRGIFEDNDRSKRLMAVINFNTDISNFWEYSSSGLTPVDESNEAFELGVDYIIYGLTH
ncbi:MAG: DUF4159 domain-containing protein [Vicinamibacterales bacterium]